MRGKSNHGILGYQPEMVAPIGSVVPNPADIHDPQA